MKEITTKEDIRRNINLVKSNKALDIPLHDLSHKFKNLLRVSLYRQSKKKL